MRCLYSRRDLISIGACLAFVVAALCAMTSVSNQSFLVWQRSAPPAAANDPSAPGRG